MSRAAGPHASVGRRLVARAAVSASSRIRSQVEGELDRVATGAVERGRSLPRFGLQEFGDVVSEFGTGGRLMARTPGRSPP